MQTPLSFACDTNRRQTSAVLGNENASGTPAMFSEREAVRCNADSDVDRFPQPERTYSY